MSHQFTIRGECITISVVVKAVSRKKHIFQFFRKNYFLTIFILCICFVGIVVVGRTFVAKPNYIYVKVKVGQGYWWATTLKPNSWYAKSFKTGEISYDLLGKPNAQILDVRVYPAVNQNWTSSQYDVFVTLKLKVAFSKSTGEYSFDRSPISISSPIDIQFPQQELTGTVIELSQKEFKEHYVDKIIYLVSQGGYLKDFPFRYDEINIGDKYFDGKDNVFEVLDKNLQQVILPVQNNLSAEVFDRAIDTSQNILVKAKVKLREKSDGLYYGEDYKVVSNASIPFSTNSYLFENFYVRGIE